MVRYPIDVETAKNFEEVRKGLEKSLGVTVTKAKFSKRYIRPLSIKLKFNFK